MKNLVLMIGITSLIFCHTSFLKENIYTKPKIHKIPKKIHQVWVGKKPIPQLFKRCMKSCKKVHPDWEYKLWTDEDIEDFEWENRKNFDRVTNPGLKSDLWKYEIIHRHGGVYVDCDMDCRRPFDPLQERLEFFIGYLSDKRDWLAVHLFAGVPGSRVLKAVIDEINERIDGQDLSSPGGDDVLAATGPVAFTHVVNDLGLIDGDLEFIFPWEYFHPVRHQNRGRIKSLQERRNVKYKCFGVHYNGSSWNR